MLNIIKNYKYSVNQQNNAQLTIRVMGGGPMYQHGAKQWILVNRWRHIRSLCDVIALPTKLT